MPTTIGVQLTPYAGTATTMTIELLAAGVLLNTGGSTLTEGTNGYFTASITQDLVTGYNAIIKSNGVSVAEGYLHLGQTVVDSEAPVDLTSVLTALGNVPSVEEISDRIERNGGPLSTAIDQATIAAKNTQ